MCLLDLIEKTAANRPIDVSFNINETGCMIFNPYVKHKIVIGVFFTLVLLAIICLLFLHLKYIGHNR